MAVINERECRSDQERSQRASLDSEKDQKQREYNYYNGRGKR